MRDDLFQEIATFVLILGAAFYVVRRVWIMFHPMESDSGGCGGGCSSCSLSKGAESTSPVQVVSIGMPQSRNR